MQVLLFKDGRQEGPFTLEELDRMLQAEEITGDDLYWCEETKEWRRLATIPGYVPPGSAEDLDLQTDSIPTLPPPSCYDKPDVAGVSDEPVPEFLRGVSAETVEAGGSQWLRMLMLLVLLAAVIAGMRYSMRGTRAEGVANVSGGTEVASTPMEVAPQPVDPPTPRPAAPKPMVAVAQTEDPAPAPTPSALPLATESAPAKQAESPEAIQGVPAPSPVVPVQLAFAATPKARSTQSLAMPIGFNKSTPAPGGIALHSTWKSPLGHSFGGGSQTIADLKVALQAYGEPSDFTGAAPEKMILKDVRYLAPLPEIEAKFGIQRKERSNVKIGCPGFPEGLVYFSYDAELEPGFNRTYIVIDGANQVCAVQLVDEKPKGGSYYGSGRNGPWITYNFVNYRVKAKREMGVLYQLTGPTIKGDPVTLAGWNAWQHRAASSSGAEGICLTSELVDKNKVLERVKLYLPQPLVNIILYCVQGRQLR